jgi:hypothetical protein
LTSTQTNVSGTCGEIVAPKGKSGVYLLNPLVAAQDFEYKMSSILDKPLENIFGYITVLSGAFAAYWYIALQLEVSAIVDSGPTRRFTYFVIGLSRTPHTRVGYLWLRYIYSKPSTGIGGVGISPTTQVTEQPCCKNVLHPRPGLWPFADVVRTKLPRLCLAHHFVHSKQKGIPLVFKPGPLQGTVPSNTLVSIAVIQER